MDDISRKKFNQARAILGKPQIPDPVTDGIEVEPTISFAEVRKLDRGEFHPPAKDGEIAIAQAEFSPFVFTEELWAMYQAFDGWEIESGVFEFLSLARAMEIRNELKVLHSEFGGTLPRALFPFFEGGESLYFTVLSRELKPRAQVVSICYSDGDSDFVSNYWSITEFAECIYANTYVSPQERNRVYPLEDLPASWL